MELPTTEHLSIFSWDVFQECSEANGFCKSFSVLPGCI